jgi:hypothetical protein
MGALPFALAGILRSAGISDTDMRDFPKACYGAVNIV